MQGGESFAARLSRLRPIMLCVFAFGFVAIGLWMIGAFGEVPTGFRRVPDWAIPYLGWACILFFGTFALIHLGNALRGGVALRIDATGILVPTFSKRVIDWSDIKDFRLSNVMGTKFVVLEVDKDRAATFATYWRLTGWLNGLFIGGGWPIAVNNSNRSADEVLEAARAFRPVVASRRGAGV